MKRNMMIGLLILGAGILAVNMLGSKSAAYESGTPSAGVTPATITTVETTEGGGIPSVQAYTHAPVYNIIVEGSEFPEIAQPAVIPPDVFFAAPLAAPTAAPQPVLQVGALTREPLPEPTTETQAQFFRVIDKLWAGAV